MMTRKHFTKLANVLAQNKFDDNLLKDIISFCKSENARFDADRFTKYIYDLKAELNHEEKSGEQRVIDIQSPLFLNRLIPFRSPLVNSWGFFLFP